MVGHCVLEIVHVSSATCCHGPCVKARPVMCVRPFCSHSSGPIRIHSSLRFPQLQPINQHFLECHRATMVSTQHGASHKDVQKEGKSHSKIAVIPPQPSQMQSSI